MESLVTIGSSALADRNIGDGHSLLKKTSLVSIDTTGCLLRESNTGLIDTLISTVGRGIQHIASVLADDGALSLLDVLLREAADINDAVIIGANELDGELTI